MSIETGEVELDNGEIADSQNVGYWNNQNESFFGAYTPGSTLPMVFKIEDDFTLSYVGFLPNIHDYVRYIYKK